MKQKSTFTECPFFFCSHFKFAVMFGSSVVLGLSREDSTAIASLAMLHQAVKGQQRRNKCDRGRASTVSALRSSTVPRARTYKCSLRCCTESPFSQKIIIICITSCPTEALSLLQAASEMHGRCTFSEFKVGCRNLAGKSLKS